MKYCDTFLQKAQALTPELLQTIVYPKGTVDILYDANEFLQWKAVETPFYPQIPSHEFGKGEKFVLDFGSHYVGYFKMDIRYSKYISDAPLRLKFKFAETPMEIGRESSSYHGGLSSSWLQEEIVTVDRMPVTLELPRRYSFRYVEITVMDTSPIYKVFLSDFICTAISSADMSKVEPLPEGRSKEKWEEIDRISLITLRDCMQSVFEDGPKRDRRLWLGDLRLQAIANYESYKNYNLVKRCLYLFAGMIKENGATPSCVYYNMPGPAADEECLFFDYALFFISTLYDYYCATGELEIVEELWDTAYRQIEYALTCVDDSFLVKTGSVFIDWNKKNKQTAAQGVFIYTLKDAVKLAALLHKDAVVTELNGYIQKASQTILTLYDMDAGFFVSGPQREISWISQVWAVLAQVKSRQENIMILNKLFSGNMEMDIRTPYMYHHLVQALFDNGLEEQAENVLQNYWGTMIQNGADSFWEVYNPQNGEECPYGDYLINSFCHAWSCTPTYFIRKYICKRNKISNEID